MSNAASNDPIVISAARWFWWIAGLSLVNSVLFHSGSDLNFVIGLGLTTVADALFADQLVIAVAITAVILGFYFFMGFKAQQGQLWAFYIGLAVYALDALIFVPFQDWMPIGFHALAIFFIFKGVMRARELQSAEGATGQA